MGDKILIIGAAGLVGSALYQELLAAKHFVIGADNELLDDDLQFINITDQSSIQKVIARFEPRIIILTAAMSNVEYCEEHPEESSKVNIDGLKNVIQCMDSKKSKLVFFSSDYVFDGISGPYSEADALNPLCVYGKDKVLGEELIKKSIADHLIVRTTWVYGPEVRGKNFVLNVIKKLKNNQKIKVPTDQIGSPTYSKCLARAVRELIENESRGIFNIVGPDLIDRYNFAKEICGIFNLDISHLIPLPTRELHQKAKRPLKGGLKIDKLQKEISYRMLGYQKGLLALRES